MELARSEPASDEDPGHEALQATRRSARAWAWDSTTEPDASSSKHGADDKPVRVAREIKDDVLDHFLEGTTQRYFVKHVDAWWMEMQTVKHPLSRFHHSV